MLISNYTKTQDEQILVSNYTKTQGQKKLISNNTKIHKDKWMFISIYIKTKGQLDVN